MGAGGEELLKTGLALRTNTFRIASWDLLLLKHHVDTVNEMDLEADETTNQTESELPYEGFPVLRLCLFEKLGSCCLYMDCFTLSHPFCTSAHLAYSRPPRRFLGSGLQAQICESRPRGIGSGDRSPVGGLSIERKESPFKNLS